MIVEVVGGADERPEARVVDVDDLGRVHLALGQVTDDEAAEALAKLDDPENTYQTPVLVSGWGRAPA